MADTDNAVGSIVFVIVALGITIFAQARKAAAWGPESITAICLAISIGFSIGCYFISWICVEWRIQAALKAMG